MTTTLGQLLTQWRSQRGLTLRELGRRAGIAHTTLGRWEKGTFLPRLPELEAVVTALNTTEAQRRQALALLDAPRMVAYRRQETAKSAPDFAKAAGGVPGEGAILRAMRLRAGKTLEKVAQVIGVAPRTLSRWERSEMRPDAARLHTLCYVLGASDEEVAALPGLEGMTALIPKADDVAQIATMGLALRLGEWKPPAALTELVHLGLEAQAWRLIPQQPHAKNVLFALYYWHMKTLFDNKRFDLAAPYVRRVLALSERMPERIEVPPAEREEHFPMAHEVQSRALLYQTVSAAQRAPDAGRTLARRLAREWRGAYDVYFRAWMMSEAAAMLAKAGEMETARDWSHRACEEANTGDPAHWTEALFRRRDYAALLLQIGRNEEALTALEASAELNRPYPECRVRYHLLRAETYLGLGRPSPAQEELMQARNVAQGAEPAYLNPHIQALESCF